MASEDHPGPRAIYENWLPVIEFFGPQPMDEELAAQDAAVEQTNRTPGQTAGGPTERVAP